MKKARTAFRDALDLGVTDAKLELLERNIAHLFIGKALETDSY